MMDLKWLIQDVDGAFPPLVLSCLSFTYHPKLLKIYENNDLCW